MDSYFCTILHTSYIFVQYRGAWLGAALSPPSSLTLAKSWGAYARAGMCLSVICLC